MHVGGRELSTVLALALTFKSLQCSMLPRVKYLDVAQILAAQKEVSQPAHDIHATATLIRRSIQVILSKIRALSKSHIVHTGLEVFKGLEPGKSIDPSQVPGLKESGWTPEMDEL